MSGKMITSAVGVGGKNNSADVATVQYLLNCVPVSSGGPAKELAIDGFAGVLTKQAITGFQQFNFGKSDGRVDPGHSTIALLNSFDPLPFTPVVVPGAGNKSLSPKVEGKVGVKVPGLYNPKVEMPGYYAGKMEMPGMHTPKVESPGAKMLSGGMINPNIKVG